MKAICCFEANLFPVGENWVSRNEAGADLVLAQTLESCGVSVMVISGDYSE